jgi:soluble lytic murein transglycosylase-like protein
MAVGVPTTLMPPVPERVREITARFDPTTGAPTGASTGDDFASLLSRQLLDQSNTSLMSALTGSSDDSSGSTSTLGGSSWMSALSGLLGQSGTSGSGGVTGSDVVTDATQYLGVPYKWGGTDPDTGLDCSGLTQRTYADLGISLPRTAAAQAKVGTPVDSLADAQPGDLIAFGQPVDHIAIYAGNGNIIQAPHTGDVVKVSSIKRPIVAIRRIVGSSTATGSTSSTNSIGALAQWTSALSSTSGSAAATNTSAAPYQALFNAAGAKYGIDPQVLSSVARVESGYNPNAVSSAGAVGLMQFMPGTAAGMGIDPKDPAQAIDGAARYLSTQIKNFGSIPLALAAYNAGPAAVKKYGGIPPYSETQNYVTKVMSTVGSPT